MINPLMADGQLHGGIVQGLGQALLEDVVYDTQTGQTLTGSLMDYTLPRADDVPALATRYNEITEGDNELGVKGIGEGGFTGAVPAVMSAVRDAIASGGGGHVDMPATPERVWRALRRRRSPR